jgi:hypothetical protein
VRTRGGSVGSLSDEPLDASNTRQDNQSAYSVADHAHRRQGDHSLRLVEDGLVAEREGAGVVLSEPARAPWRGSRVGTRVEDELPLAPMPYPGRPGLWQEERGR